jgi:hypothetical protein
MPELMAPKEVARFPRLSPNTPTMWRSKGSGPLFTYVGAAIRYSRADSESWLEQNKARLTRPYHRRGA